MHRLQHWLRHITEGMFVDRYTLFLQAMKDIHHFDASASSKAATILSDKAYLAEFSAKAAEALRSHNDEKLALLSAFSAMPEPQTDLFG